MKITQLAHCVAGLYKHYEPKENELSTNQAPMGRATNLHERIHQTVTKANAPMSCGACGGTHFNLVRAEEFTDNGYNSATFRSISTNTDPAYVCLCGQPYPMKDSAVGKGSSEGSRARYLKSLSLAIDYRKKQGLSAIADGTVSIAEHQQVVEQVNGLIETVAWLEETVNLLAHPEEAAETEEGTAEGKPAVEATPETPAKAAPVPVQKTGAKQASRQGRN
jgi:hypothetical protein